MSFLKKRLMSNENIFLSIYLVNSYVFNKELLSPEDREELLSLEDIYNSEKINSKIIEVKDRLNKIIESEDDYFETNVFFKPKKLEGRGKNVFRPLHTSSLTDQIAMIAMLQVLVYDIDAKTNKLIPSELSRLLPSNFYGNRISYDGLHLFKPWKDQYQEYIAKANDILYLSNETLEYKYEVNLDLENFFPSINPQVLFSFITKHLPLKFEESEQKVLYQILKKLLIFKIDSLNSTEILWYLKEDFSKSKKSTDIKYTKGIPQGGLCRYPHNPPYVE